MPEEKPKFTLDKFNPTVAELTTLAEKYKWLTIKGVDDKEWYLVVKTAQLELRDKRVYIAKTLKEYRQEAINFQNAVLGQEKELIAIIDEVEAWLKAERKRIDEEVAVEKRKAKLWERKEILEVNSIVWTDEYILWLDDLEFNRLVMVEEQAQMARHKAEIEKEKAELEEEKLKLQRDKDDEKLRKETEEKTRIETEERMKREAKDKENARLASEKEAMEVMEQQKKADAEKVIAEEKKAIEDIERKQKEEADKKLQEEQEAIDKQTAIEADTKYKERLKRNDFNAQDFRIADDWKRKVMWKYVSEFILD